MRVWFREFIATFNLVMAIVLTYLTISTNKILDELIEKLAKLETLIEVREEIQRTEEHNENGNDL